MSMRPCLDALRCGTGVATLSLSASLKTACLAYARACARVRGGPKRRGGGGVKAVTPRTATRRRATPNRIVAGVVSKGHHRSLIDVADPIDTCRKATGVKKNGREARGHETARPRDLVCADAPHKAAHTQYEYRSRRAILTNLHALRPTVLAEAESPHRRVLL